MAISKLLTDITPDHQLQLTSAEANEQMEGFTFAGAGWYTYQGSWMLVVGTDTPDEYYFLLFFNRDPRSAYKAISIAPINTIPEATTIPVAKIVDLAKRVRFIYWGGIAVLWALTLLVGNKWGLRAELPILALMFVWPYAIRKWVNREKKHDNA